MLKFRIGGWELLQVSGGVYNGANPPAYSRARRKELAALLALPEPEGGCYPVWLGALVPAFTLACGFGVWRPAYDDTGWRALISACWWVGIDVCAG
jgi:hypothetical protein